MNKKQKILNLSLEEDYHIHSKNFSDGRYYIEDIIKKAKEIGLKKICITDHSDAVFPFLKRKPQHPTPREMTTKFKNTINDVTVLFGVEADLLNEQGDVCFTLQGQESELCILSVHKAFEDDMSKISQGFVNAIKRFKDKIFCIGHLHTTLLLDADILPIIQEANKANIPLEVNFSYLQDRRRDDARLRLIFEQANTIVLNSDAHSVEKLPLLRQEGMQFLKDHKYIQ